MALKQKYNTQTNAIVTYDYYELGSGTGTKLFYGLGVANQATIPVAATALAYKTILSSNAVKSEDVSTSGTTTADAQAFDIDFDLSSFNNPLAVEGTAYVTLNGSMTAADGAVDHSAVFTIKVIKYDGTTETVLGTGYSNKLGTVTSGTNVFYGVVPITCTLGTFKVGDILRVNIVATTVSNNPAQGGTILFYHEPSTAGQELVMYIPFRLNQ